MSSIFSARNTTTSSGDALSKSGILSLKYPVTNGVVSNWDDAEKLLNHCFYNEMRVAPEEHPLIMLDTPFNPEANRQKIVQIMFETFCVPVFYLVPAPVAALAASGRSSGLVLHCGGDVTQAVPVLDGLVISSSIEAFPIAGKNLTEYLIALLAERGIGMNTRAEKELVRVMKHELCFVVQNFEKALRLSRSSTVFDRQVELPDGTQITVGSELFCCPELLFNPGMKEHTNEPGIQHAILKSIQSCTSRHDELFGNIVLSGGSTMFPGLPNRLQREMEKLAPATVDDISVIARSDRIALDWVGASALAHSADVTQDWSNWITKEQYDEIGPSIISASR